MEETKPQTENAATDKPLVHRVCEACNNMFTIPAGSPDRRCPNCRKD